MTITIEITLWDNATTVAEKQDTLLRLEHEINYLTADTFDQGRRMVRITDRHPAGFTARIYWPDKTFWGPDSYLRVLCNRLHRFHYWNREDEPIQLDWNIEN